MGGFALHNILPALRAKVTALHQHGKPILYRYLLIWAKLAHTLR